MSARVEAILRERSAPRLGVSSCLLGERVRYDGGHKRDRLLTDVLGRLVEWVPVCPEVELGLGVPRASVRLERRAGGLRLVDPKSGADHTRQMERLARRRARELSKLELCGYVLKSGSPSCGLHRVPLWSGSATPARSGRGLFADTLTRACPLLPVEEEGRLGDARRRESFVERVFAYRRLHALFRKRWSLGDLVAFHAAHELQLLAHSRAHYGRMGRLVADARSLPRAELRRRYEEEFMGALAARRGSRNQRTAQ